MLRDPVEVKADSAQFPTRLEPLLLAVNEGHAAGAVKVRILLGRGAVRKPGRGFALGRHFRAEGGSYRGGRRG
jgi:hypothetical protein